MFYISSDTQTLWLKHLNTLKKPHQRRIGQEFYDFMRLDKLADKTLADKIYNVSDKDFETLYSTLLDA